MILIFQCVAAKRCLDTKETPRRSSEAKKSRPDLAVRRKFLIDQNSKRVETLRLQTSSAFCF
jgi:hypothetical protein